MKLRCHHLKLFVKWENCFDVEMIVKRSDSTVFPYSSESTSHRFLVFPWELNWFHLIIFSIIPFLISFIVWWQHNIHCCCVDHLMVNNHFSQMIWWEMKLFEKMIFFFFFRIRFLSKNTNQTKTRSKELKNRFWEKNQIIFVFVLWFLFQINKK